MGSKDTELLLSDGLLLEQYVTSCPLDLEQILSVFNTA